MLDMNNWELVGLAVDVFVVYLLNRFYKSKAKDADLVATTPTYEIGDELQSVLSTAPDKCLAYACVQGITQPVGAPLKSNYNEAIGVAQHHLFIEHKSKRTQGFWTDVKRVIKDQVNVRPFLLINTDRDEGRGWSVEVSDALVAEYFHDSLDVVHDRYQSATDGLLSRGLDRLFGEVTKGYQETERMLGVGVPVLGIGKLALTSAKRAILGPPDDGHRYILTTSSKPELIRSLRSDARTLNIFRWIFGLAGAAITAYIVYRNVVRYRSQTRSQRLLDELRLRRRAAAGDQGSADDGNGVTCVVCLSRPREVVLLDCGHICLCGDCAMALPHPKLCPMCRGPVARIVPTYIS